MGQAGSPVFFFFFLMNHQGPCKIFLLPITCVKRSQADFDKISRYYVRSETHGRR